jgi:hypothetical protein
MVRMRNWAKPEPPQMLKPAGYLAWVQKRQRRKLTRPTAGIRWLLRRRFIDAAGGWLSPGYEIFSGPACAGSSNRRSSFSRSR